MLITPSVRGKSEIDTLRQLAWHSGHLISVGHSGSSENSSYKGTPDDY